MSQSFLVFTGSEKHDILYPDVVGPFASQEEALDFVKSLGNAEVLGPDTPWPGSIVLMPPDGGYAGFAVVNAETATDPGEYAQEHWANQEDELVQREP